MTGELTDLDKFITAFDTHTDESGFDEISLFHYFKKGLNPSLVNYISTLFPIPTNLADYKQCAVVMQNTWKAQQHKKAIWCSDGWGTTLTLVTRPTPAVRAPAPDMGVPMNVDASRRSDA